MKSLETVISIIIAVIMFVFLPVLMGSDQKRKEMSLSAEAAVGVFLADTTANGAITALDYSVCCDRLMIYGYAGDFEVECIIYEGAATGKEYRFSVTWGEIEKSLRETGIYILPVGCYVKATVPAVVPGHPLKRMLWCRTEVWKCQYFAGGIVDG